MKAPVIDYQRAASVAEAVAALAEYGDEAKVLSGGQSLVPLLNMRLARPSVVIDVSRIAELRQTSELATGGIRYGAAIMHASFEDRHVPDPVGGLLHHVAGGIGYRAIRNRGTLGGSLAHADASAEWPVVMAAIGAAVVARSSTGERRIDARSMVEGFFTSALRDEELLVAVDVPPLPDGTLWGFHKAARKPGEFAESLAVALIGNDGGEVWLGAARDVPVAVPLPGLRVGHMWSAELDAAVRAAVAGTLAPSEPAPLEDRYHRHLHGVTAGRAVAAALAARDTEAGT